jgi:membrane protein required for colicin V production
VTALDYIVLAVVALSVAAGWRRGLIRGALALASALVGLILAANFYGPAGALLSGITTTRRAADLLGFALIFAATLTAGSLLGYRLRRALDRSRLGSVDRGLGALLGLGRAWLVCSALYLGLTAFPIHLETVERSAFAPALVAGTRVLSYAGSEDLRQRFARGYEALNRLWGTSDDAERRQ